jgi:hypothetical protein
MRSGPLDKTMYIFQNTKKKKYPLNHYYISIFYRPLTTKTIPCTLPHYLPLPDFVETIAAPTRLDRAD